MRGGGGSEPPGDPHDPGARRGSSKLNQETGTGGRAPNRAESIVTGTDVCNGRGRGACNWIKLTRRDPAEGRHTFGWGTGRAGCQVPPSGLTE